MKRWVVLLVIACLIRLPAATPPLPPQDPRPMVDPALPAIEGHILDRDEDLVNKIRRRLRWIDGRISHLIGERAGTLPLAAIPSRPELQEIRAERDEAWMNLQAVLEAPDHRLPRRQPAVTDLAPSQNGDEVLRELQAQHRFTLAMVSKEAFQRGGSVDLELLQRGLQFIDDTTLADLPFGYRPQLDFLRIWFIAERLRLLPRSPERASARQGLEELTKEFAVRHPRSELQDNVRLLLEMLRVDDEVAATRRRLEAESGPAAAKPAPAAEQ